MYKHYAFKYYKDHIINPSKFEILQKYNFNINGSVHSCDWEVFTAILFDKKKLSFGCSDLEGYEVKSAHKGNSFEYQYHKNLGLKKLESDRNSNHIFIIYDNNYLDIDVYILNNNAIDNILVDWGNDLIKNYENDKQRFRKSLTYNFVMNNSFRIMSIVNGELAE